MLPFLPLSYRRDRHPHPRYMYGNLNEFFEFCRPSESAAEIKKGMVHVGAKRWF